MALYIGCKVIQAKPALADKQYGDYQEGSIGYEIIYPDGYKSWSPAEVFENVYRRMSHEELAFIREHG